LNIADLRKALSAKLTVPAALVDKSIAKIDRRNEESVYWTEYLISLQEEGKRREIVADA
jgi:hypothetical protein